MTTLIKLKVEVEKRWGSKMKMSFVGGLEAHLIARELGNFTLIPREGNIPQQTPISQVTTKSASSWTLHVRSRSCGVDAECEFAVGFPSVLILIVLRWEGSMGHLSRRRPM